MEIQHIAKLNDALRRCIPFLPSPHFMTMSRAVQALTPDQQLRVLIAVKNFAAFNNDNDPYLERDFGAVTVDGEKYFFKIDSVDQGLKHFDPDGRRVLMVMRADEY